MVSDVEKAKPAFIVVIRSLSVLYNCCLDISRDSVTLGNVSLRNVLCAVCFTFVFGCCLWKKAWPFAARITVPKVRVKKHRAKTCNI